MGRTLDIHPLVVLVVTALGGFLAGIVGLILAVPFTVIAAKAIGLLRAKGFFRLVADRAQPARQEDAQLTRPPQACGGLRPPRCAPAP